MLLISNPVCLAIQNPIDMAGDTIRRNTNSAVDDVISKIKISTNETIDKAVGGVKRFIKAVLSGALEIFTVMAICWIFTFLVGKTTAKMIIVVAITLGITEFIKLLIKVFDIIGKA